MSHRRHCRVRSCDSRSISNLGFGNEIWIIIVIVIAIVLFWSGRRRTSSLVRRTSSFRRTSC